MRGNDAEFPQEHEVVDWESDDEGVLWGRQVHELRQGSSYAKLKRETEHVNLDLSTTDRPVASVDIGAAVRMLVETGADPSQYVSVELDADGAELLAAQLELAASLARDGEVADVRR